MSYSYNDSYNDAYRLLESTPTITIYYYYSVSRMWSIEWRHFQ